MIYRTYESFNKSNDIRDLAWLYFLAFIYDGEMVIKTWGGDNIMGVKFLDSMKRLEPQGLVKIGDEKVTSTKKAVKESIKTFYRDTMKEAFDLSIDLQQYDIKGLNGYTISKIPLELWKQFSTFEDAFDSWHDDFFVPWWNTHGEDRVLKKYIRKNKESVGVLNEYHLRNYYFPKPLPEKITVYRGIKSDYDPEHTKGYTSWTLSKDQAKRFATYHFTQRYASKGIEAHSQTILEANVDLKDIVVFVGGDEHEVVLKEPVKVDKVTKIK